jgi:hypothetical protein
MEVANHVQPLDHDPAAGGGLYLTQSGDMLLEKGTQTQVELFRVGLGRRCAELVNVSVARAEMCEQKKIQIKYKQTKKKSHHAMITTQ